MIRILQYNKFDNKRTKHIAAEI